MLFLFFWALGDIWGLGGGGGDVGRCVVARREGEEKRYCERMRCLGGVLEDGMAWVRVTRAIDLVTYTPIRLI